LSLDLKVLPFRKAEPVTVFKRMFININLPFNDEKIDPILI